MEGLERDSKEDMLRAEYSFRWRFTWH